jgi:hypothetical protein
MTALSALQFEFEGQPLRIPAAELDSSPSPFTGRSLRHANTNVTVAPHEVDLVKRLIESSPVADNDGTLWSGHLDVESYQEGEPHSLTITWEETEEVHAEAVEFEGLSLQPTKYEEHENGDGTIAVGFRAVLTAEETEALRALMPVKRSSVVYWPVVRRGVSDAPRQMRLGRVLWQQLPDGTVGHDITIVDDAFDQSEEPNHVLGLAGEPMVSNLVARVSDLLAQFQILIAELEVTEALPAESLERIRASVESLGPAQRHAFYEVADLSKW